MRAFRVYLHPSLPRFAGEFFMTAASKALNRWHMADTGEQRVVQDEDWIAQIKALTKWGEEFAARQQEIRSQINALHERIDSLVDLVGATDSKTSLAMSEIRAIAGKLDRLHGWAEPKRKLEEAQALVEADALLKAERWRKRIIAASPFVKWIVLTGAFVVSVYVMAKGGPNILPWILK